jgi:hypothetical protein
MPSRHPPKTKTGHPRSKAISAFSVIARNDENWTTISDMPQRRKIQNRIAQRSYRKWNLLITTTTISHEYLGIRKNERMKDLERLVALNSASPALAEIPTSCAEKKSGTREGISKSNITSVRPSLDSSEYPQPIRTPEPPQITFLPSPNEYLFSESFTRPTSHSPPPPVAYSPLSDQPPYAASSSTSYPDSAIYDSSFASPRLTQPQHILPSNEIPDETPALLYGDYLVESRSGLGHGPAVPPCSANSDEHGFRWH